MDGGCWMKKLWLESDRVDIIGRWEMAFEGGMETSFENARGQFFIAHFWGWSTAWQRSAEPSRNSISSFFIVRNEMSWVVRGWRGWGKGGHNVFECVKRGGRLFCEFYEYYFLLNFFLFTSDLLFSWSNKNLIYKFVSVPWTEILHLKMMFIIIYNPINVFDSILITISIKYPNLIEKILKIIQKLYTVFYLFTRTICILLKKLWNKN